MYLGIFWVLCSCAQQKWRWLAAKVIISSMFMAVQPQIHEHLSISKPCRPVYPLVNCLYVSWLTDQLIDAALKRSSVHVFAFALGEYWWRVVNDHCSQSQSLFLAREHNGQWAVLKNVSWKWTFLKLLYRLVANSILLTTIIRTTGFVNELLVH